MNHMKFIRAFCSSQQDSPSGQTSQPESNLYISCSVFATPWTITCQVPLSMGFSRQEHWSGLPFPSPGDLPNPGIKPGSPTLQVDSLPAEPPGKPKECQTISKMNSTNQIMLGNFLLDFIMCGLCIHSSSLECRLFSFFMITYDSTMNFFVNFAYCAQVSVSFPITNSQIQNYFSQKLKPFW